MLKRRVIIGLMFDDGVLVRTKRFMPDYRYTQSFLAVDAIDEAILVDVTRAGPSEASHGAMAAFADRCFAPVTMGGWIRSEDDVSRFFDLGADKVVIGRGASEKGLIEAVAHRWGCQAAVVGIDEWTTGASPEGGGAEILLRRAAEAEACGAGEIYFQSVGQDGSLLGYAMPLLRQMVQGRRIPVTVGSGCGSWKHMQEAFEAGATGAVTTCVHHWTESALRGFKERLHGAGVPVRVAA